MARNESCQKRKITWRMSGILSDMVIGLAPFIAAKAFEGFPISFGVK
jgi:hypothetical protein